MTEHDASLHRRAWDAIPWVVAGAASTDERRCVEEHLPRCTECQAEWALQQRVHAGLNASVPAEAALPSTRAGWQRLASRLDVADELQLHAQPRVATPLLRALGGRTPEPASRQTTGEPTGSRWTRWLVAAVLVQAVGLGALGTALLDRGRDAPEGEFRTLSLPPAVPAAVRVRVVPAPGLDFAALRQMLADSRMVAVEVGPDGSSLGLAAADGDPRTVAAALPQLRASPLLMLVEPVPAPR